MIDWVKYGFKPMKVNKDTVYTRLDFPLIIQEQNGFLSLVHVPGDLGPSLVSSGKIPATNQAVVLLLKAFNCPKLP